MKRATLGVLAAGWASVAVGSFTPGNIIVSQGNQGIHPSRISEYTQSGVFVQYVTVPTLAGQNISDYNRGMAFDFRGRLHVFNGTFVAGLSTYEPTSSTWSTITIPGLSVANSVDFGKIATFGDYVFLPDHSTAGAEAHGIVRVDMTDGSWIRFGTPASTNDDSIDLNIGPSGLLYSLTGTGSPSGVAIEVWDPLTLAHVRTIDLASLAWGAGGIVREAVPRGNGEIWANQLYSPSFLLDSNGQVLSTYTFSQTSYDDDFDVAGDGSLLQADYDGRIYLYDALFSQTTFFDTNGAQSFGSFVPELGTRVTPRQYSTVRGVLASGGLYSTYRSDDDRLSVRAGPVLFAGESPVQIAFDGFSPVTTPSELRFKLEASVNTPGLLQTLYLYNYQTSAYEAVDQWSGSVSDMVVQYVESTNPERFIDPSTRAVKAKVTYKQVGPVLLWPWSARIDQAQWTFMP